MYLVSDIIEMGNTHELVLSCIKEPPTIDDSHPLALSPEEAFDE
jgi:hypothetical protein